MKLNKTLALVALVAGSLVAGATLQAQDSPIAPKTPPPGGPHGAQGGPGMRARPNIDQLAKELNLKDDQKTKVKAALEENQAKVRELRENTSLAQEEKRAKAKEIIGGFVAKMKDILTPEQFEKWQKHVEQQLPPHPPKGGGDKHSAGGDNVPK